MSPLLLLYLSVGRSSNFSLSFEGKSDRVGTILVARLCTLSMSLMSLPLYGLHMELQYSKCGLTRLLYKTGKLSLFMYLKVLLIDANTPFAFCTTLLICFSNLSDSSICTPTSGCSLMSLMVD